MACVRLHNLCIERNMPLPEALDVNIDDNQEELNQPENGPAYQHRDNVVRSLQL